MHKISDKRSRILSFERTVSIHEGFYFYTNIGDSTGVVAMSLRDFLDKLQTIDSSSIEFHFHRQDFEKWIKEVLCDDKLYQRISGLDKTIKGEELRLQITEIVKRSLEELERSDVNVMRSSNDDTTGAQYVSRL